MAPYFPFLVVPVVALGVPHVLHVPVRADSFGSPSSERRASADAEQEPQPDLLRHDGLYTACGTERSGPEERRAVHDRGTPSEIMR